MHTDINKKEFAIKLRKRGKSIRNIENILNISRSTLSGWLRNIKLTKEQKDGLRQKWIVTFKKARIKAIKINKERQLKKIGKIKQSAKHFVSNIIIDKNIGEIIFTTFYLAEGSKREGMAVIANSNPKILSTFLNLFRYLYSPKKSKFRCCLHLRNDQSEEKLKKYWSKILHIPKSQFIKTQFDKRTRKPTFKNYKGVGVVSYYDSDLQRRILYTGEELLKIMKNV